MLKVSRSSNSNKMYTNMSSVHRAHEKKFRFNQHEVLEENYKKEGCGAGPAR